MDEIGKVTKALNRELNFVNRKWRGCRDHWEDARSIGLISYFEGKSLGMDIDAAKKYAVRQAANFLAREYKHEKRAIKPKITWINNEENEWSELDIFVRTMPQQEECADASKISAIIGNSELAEMIAYGSRSEGGMARIRAEIRVKAFLEKTSARLSPNQE